MGLYLLISQLTWAQAIKFEVVTGTFQYDDAKSVIQTTDSGFVVVGSTSGLGFGQSDVYLTKLDKTGKVKWQRALGGPGVDKGNSVIQTPDSGFAIAGYTNSSGMGGYDVYLAKTDKDGMLQWSNSYGGIDWDFGNYLTQTSNGDFVICGNTYSYGNGSGDAYLLKTNSAGVLQWDSAYGGSREDMGNSVCIAPDGGYIVTGYTESMGEGDKDVYFFKTNPSGNTLWSKSFGGSAEDTGAEGKITLDGGIIIGATSSSFHTGAFHENCFIKTDSDGNMAANWPRIDAISCDRHITTVDPLEDGGYIFGGYTNSLGQDDYFLYHTDSDGWYVLGGYSGYGGNAEDQLFQVKQTNDSGFVAVGVTNSYGNGKPNIYIIKTDYDLYASGTVQVVVGVEEELPIHKNISLYPNPATDHFMLNAESTTLIEIRDMVGKLAQTSTVQRGTREISTAGLPDGVYLVNIKSEKSLSIGKIVVRH